MKIWLLTPVLLLMACETLNTEPAYLLLADEVLINTPEHTHYAPGSTFSWCLYERIEDDQLPSVTEAIISKLGERYTVYLTHEEIPKDRQIFYEGQFVGYDDGFSYQVRLELLSPTRVKVYYKDFENGLAASRHYKVYTWKGTSWKITKRSRMTVS